MIAIFGFLAVLLYGLSFLVLLSLEMRLAPRMLVWRTISSHALGEGRRDFDLYGILMIFGVLSQTAAFALTGGFGPALTISLLVMAAMLSGLLIYPTDSEGIEPGQLPVRARQREGVIHLRFAIGCFAAAALIILLAQPRMAALISGGFLLLLDWVAIGAMAGVTGLVVTGFIPRLNGYFGLAERGFFYMAALWFVLSAVALTAA